MKRAKKLFALLLCMLLCVGLMPTMAFATGGSVISNLTATRDSETTATITFDSTQAGSVAIVFKNGNGSFELYIGNKDGVTVGTNVITYEQLTGSDAKEIAVYFGTDDSDFYALYSSPNPLDEPGAVKGTVPVVHTCVGQGDWQYDPDNHWKLCGVCGNRVDEVAHSGGTATCTTPAVCEVCQHAYGSVNSGNHSGKIVWTQTETTHSSAYECCGVPVVAEEAHDWQNGVCSECGYECQHSGGEATCTAPAICELCGQSYGSVDPDNHTGKVVWTQAETGHSSAYDCCDTAVVTNQPHTYEWVTDKEATATEAGSKHEKCTVCDRRYDRQHDHATNRRHERPVDLGRTDACIRCGADRRYHTFQKAQSLLNPIRLFHRLPSGGRFSYPLSSSDILIVEGKAFNQPETR